MSAQTATGNCSRTEHLHALQLASLPSHHKDPFDRLIIAQAQTERLPVLTVDSQFPRYDLRLLWAS